MTKQRTGPSLWVARAIVRVAAARAPDRARAAMRAEWDAELRRVAAEEGWRMVPAALGAFADAEALRDVSKSRTGGAPDRGPTRWAWEMRTAIRSLLRAPGFTIVAGLTLAVGIGGASAIFTLLDRAVLAPLPYPESERLVRLENQVSVQGPEASIWQLSTAQYVYYAEESRTAEHIGLFRPWAGNIVTAGEPIRARAVQVTASMMELLGATTHEGRLLTPADDQPGAESVALLSYDFWATALGADPTTVGSTLTFSDRPYAIVGILGRNVELPGLPGERQPDVWTTLSIDREAEFYNNHVFPAIARLVDTATPEQLESELEQLERGLPERFPRAYSEGFLNGSSFRTIATPLREHVLGDLARNLWVLFGGVMLVVGIAAANTANLLVVRIEGKRRELSLRSALGADRGDLARSLMAEGLVLAFLGGVGALAIGFWGVPVLTALSPAELPRIHGARPGLGVVGFTLTLSAAVGVVIGAASLVTSRRATASDLLSEGGRTSSSTRRSRRIRSSLVVSQLTLALALVVCAGMLLDSLGRLHSTHPGFEPEGVLAIDLHLTAVRYPDDLSLWSFYRQISNDISALPGVTAVGLGEVLPVSGGFGCTVQGFEEPAVYQRLRDAGLSTCAGQVRVSPGYFESLGVELAAGRFIEPGDLDDPSRAAVVVTRAAAERFWPGEDPIGKGIGPSGRDRAPFHRVVGVVDDFARASDDGRPPLSQVAIGVFYGVVDNPEVEGNWYWWPGDMTLLVRTDGVPPSTLVPAIRAAILAVDPEVPVANARLMTDVVDRAVAHVSFVSTLLGIAAAVALLLAAIGLYGVVATLVSRRTREIGMRLAIGASPSSVRSLVVLQTLRLAAAGVAFGIPVAVALSAVGTRLIVGVEPTRPTTYLMAAGVMAVIAIVAAWAPALRASGVDPAVALRAE